MPELFEFQVAGIVDQIVKFGKVTRPILGIKFAPDQSVEQLGVSGVLVLDAPPSGPAGKAVYSQIFSELLTYGITQIRASHLILEIWLWSCLL